MSNYTHYRRVGATGGLITDTLSDASGEVDLTGWTGLVIIALHPDSEAVKFQGTITPNPNQVINTGQISYQPISTDVDTDGEFRFYYKGTDPNGDDWYFPTNDPAGARAYGKLVIY